MSDHLITLSDKQENAAQSIVDELNTLNAIRGGTSGTLTVDQWMKRIILSPIKQRIDQLDALKIQPIVTALPDATNSQLNQIKTILGI